MSKQVIVVGSGLAGLTAACELLEKGCNVTIIEKHRNLGGNSSKATTGIAVPGSSLQQASGIKDTGADLTTEGPAAKDLVQNGVKDVEWLLALAGCKDEMMLRLTPGHGKVARTLSTSSQFPGMVVTYAVIHQLEEISKAKPDRLNIVTSATVTKLLTEGSKVTGVEYSAGGTQKLKGVVLIATGGFSGDMAPTSLMAQHAPSLMKLPTTSDERDNGDGIRLATSVNAATKNMNMITMTPTAAVIPGMEADKFKIVISDAICGAGGKFINADGRDFVDALQTNAVRSEAMMKDKAPFRLVITEKDAANVQWLVDFYTNRNVMKKYGSAAQLATEMRVPAGNLKFDGPIFVANITPAVYTCAGGLSTGYSGSTSGKVLTASGAAVEGLFAAGEAAACMYPGAWSISGVPLLQCIYTGRMAGKGAAEALGANEKKADLTSIAKALAAPAEEAKKKPEDMSREELIAYAKELESRPAAAAAPAADAAPAGITEAEVAKHNTKADAWIILNGQVIDVTKWIPIHPGGEQAIEAFLGKDASEEWNMIHKPGMVEKNAQHLTMMGPLGSGGGGGAAAPAAGIGDGGMPMAEVEKHNKKEDCWIVLNGEAIDVTKWIPIHPGGEQAIMSFAGKDATEEWVVIHKPGTVEKNMQHLTKKGKVSGAAAAAAPVGPVEDEAPAPDGNGGIPGIIGAAIFLVWNVILMVLRTVFFTGNFKFTLDNNRKGTIRSAIFLITFTIVHALGNFVDMLSGPDELNGEGYLFDRIHWTGAFGLLKDFPFSVVEEYLALAILLHVSVALKRSWDISMGYTIAAGRWNMMLSGLVILFFVTKHLQDFRFYPDYDYVLLNAPKYMIAFDSLTAGYIFAEPEGKGEVVKARDLYSREVVLFKDINTVLLYTACITVFATHLCLGWKKLIPADMMQIPRDHQQTVIYMGWVAAICVAGMYISVPWYVYFATPQVVPHVN